MLLKTLCAYNAFGIYCYYLNAYYYALMSSLNGVYMRMFFSISK